MEVEKMMTIEEKAIEFFGLTRNYKECGYITISGKMLDLSGKNQGARGGYRTQDHREVEEILDGFNYTDALVEFMNHGNIRLNPECQGVDISVMPTKQQESVLRDYFNYFNGEILVDISDEKGYTVSSVEYREKTSSSKILTDIKNYFK